MTPTRIFLLFGACIGLALCQAQTFQSADQSWFRFAHAWPVNQQFDIFFDNLPTPIWNRVGFSHVTSYIPIEPGMVNVSIRAWGPRSTLMSLQGQGAAETTSPAATGEEQQQQVQEAMSLGSFMLEAGQFQTLALFHSPEEMQETSMTAESGSETATGAKSSASEMSSEFALEERQGWKLFMDQNVVLGDQIMFRFLHLSSDAPALRVILTPSQIQPTGATPSVATEAMIPLTVFLNDSQYMRVLAGAYDISIMSGQPATSESVPESSTTGTMESSVEESSTMESSVEESGTMESSVEESSTMESSVEESSTMESSVEESSTMESSVEQSATSSSVEESSTSESAQETSPQAPEMQLLSIQNVLLLNGNIYSLFGIGMESVSATTAEETQGAASMQSGSQQQNFGFQGVLKFDNWALIPGQVAEFPQSMETSASESEAAPSTSESEAAPSTSESETASA